MLNSNIAGDGRVKEVIVDSRINKILAMRTDSVAMLEALDAISEFYVINTVEARRALRQDLEYQNIQLSKKFLVEFDVVKERLLSVEKIAIKLEESCEGLAKKVSEADTNMKVFLDKASSLDKQKNLCLQQSTEIKNFLSRFQLSNEEIEILYHSSLDNNASATNFFQSLKRLRTAYTDCKQIIENHTYTAGFELLDILGQHQDKAYQRLFEWVKSKCEVLESSAAGPAPSNADDVDTTLHMAIRYLRKLPVYYSQCQDLVINSRRSQLVQKFVVALTQGGPSGQLYRAIDLHANDAIRYISDMLAWMHQALASEEEFLQVIFGDGQPVRENNPGKEMSSAQWNQSKSAQWKEWKDSSKEENNCDGIQGLSLEEMLARCIQGLGRPLRVRIMQTLESKPSIEILYSILDILSFYERMFHRLLPMENAVHSATKGCYLECKRLFIQQLNKQADALVQSPASCPVDLSASISTKECAKQIRDILKANSSALSSANATAKEKDLDTEKGDGCSIDEVLGSIIQPLLQSCRLSCQSLPQADMAIFMLNNVAMLQHELKDRSNIQSLQDNLKTWIDLLYTEASTWIEILISEEANRTLRRSDMDKLLELMSVLPSGIRASEQSGLNQDRVATVMRAFYASLFSTVAPQFERLMDPEMREQTRKMTAKSIADSHAQVYAIIADDFHGYDKNILAHSIEEVRVILNVD